MKKKNDYIFYCVFFAVLSVAMLVCSLVAEDSVAKGLFLLFDMVSSVMLGISVSNARQVYFYNKAMDAWANWRAEMRERDCMQVSKKNTVPFEEFDFEQDE